MAMTAASAKPSVEKIKSVLKVDLAGASKSQDVTVSMPPANKLRIYANFFIIRCELNGY